MSFPNMTGPAGGSWMGHAPLGHPGQLPQPSPQDENGLQTRHMGLKVQYTFEKDQQNCLAKWPHALHIQTIPIDERSTIGLVDLRICLQAIAQCSPEIINQHDKDYAVYALDYAEEDTPLVGQGMLSWGLEQPGLNTEQKSVTGRVVKNTMAAFRGGPPETLEVRLKLNAVPRMLRPQTSQNSGGYGSNAPTPTPTDNNSEWNSFVQSNPNLGAPVHILPKPSPGFPPARYGSPIQQVPSPAPDARMDRYAPQPQQLGLPRIGATPPTPFANLVPSLSGGYFEPVPSSRGPSPEDVTAAAQARSEKRALSKKSKATSSKKKKSTGNPPGRPRKRPRPDAGNTSAIEEATDADEAPPKAPNNATTNAKNAMDDATDADELTADGPKKKRAKTTKANWPSKAPLSSAPGSLRVAASTSGSLRTMRPAASGESRVGASHLQEIPRAPTPVPGQLPNSRGKATGQQAQFRRSSMAELDGSSRIISETGIPGPSGQDAFSPSDSVAQSPYNALTPEESPADIGSSPPVPRLALFVRSSLPPSSPVLPPMLPMPQPDSGFMSGGLDEMMDDYDLPLATQPLTASNCPSSKTVSKKKGTGPRKIAKGTAAPPPLSLTQSARPAPSATPQPPQNPFSRPASQGAMPSTSQVPHLPLEPMAGLLEKQRVLPLQPLQPLPPPPLPPPPQEMNFQHEVPGDPQLLPKQSIYNRPGSARAAAKNAQATGTIEDKRQVKRANTEPNLQRQETAQRATGPPQTDQPPTEMSIDEAEISGAERRLPDFHSTNVQQQRAEKVPHQQTEHIDHIELGPQPQEVQAQEPQAQEPQAQEPHAQEPQALKPQAQEPQAQEPQAQDPKIQELETKGPQEQKSQLQELRLQGAQVQKTGIHTHGVQEHEVEELQVPLPEAQLSDVHSSSSRLPETKPEQQDLRQQEHEQRGQVFQETTPIIVGDDRMLDAASGLPAEQRATTAAMSAPVAPESIDDADALLRLLDGSAEDLQDLDPELPTMPPAEEQSPQNIDQSAYSEAIDLTSASVGPASDLGPLTQFELAGNAPLHGGYSLTKNMSRKKSIKEKLEKAVQAGKMPSFCSNCGSISTPTWRKIWIQDSDGSPDTTNFSEEPGRITATIILEKDENGKSTKYRTVKKTLGAAEDKSEWTEEILCNPCGLWLSKYRVHRPEAKWETDITPKTRDRGGNSKTGKPKPKKRKRQNTASAHPTSEAYVTTDPIGADDQEQTPATDGEEVLLLRAPTSEPPSPQHGVRSQQTVVGLGDSSDASDGRESSKPKISGKIQSPAAEEDGMGQTRRLLFSSPKTDGQVKVLGEVAVNIVRTSASLVRSKASKAVILDKENIFTDVSVKSEMGLLITPRISGDDEEDMRGLFGTPARPSTPPPKDRPSGPCKTPTRPTPNHRPITRSVSKSIRRSTAKSPGHAGNHVHQTPTKTPTKTPPSSARLQNHGPSSAGITQSFNAHFPLDEGFLGGMPINFDSPFSSSLNQLLSEANDFTAGSDAHGLGEFELPNIGSDNALSGHLDGLDFGHFLTTDATMPSSPPVMGRMGANMSFEASDIDFSDWGAFGDLSDIPIDNGDEEDAL